MNLRKMTHKYLSHTGILIEKKKSEWQISFNLNYFHMKRNQPKQQHSYLANTHYATSKVKLL